MNTVLDDNKKLCLMSGEMIGMSSVQSMIFEVQDLAVASPATVSRCGMVYTEPSQIGWEPLLTSWLDTLPEAVEPHKAKLKNLFGWLVPPCLRFTNKECKTTLAIGIQATDEITRVNAMMKLMSSLLDCLRAETPPCSEKELPLWIENIFLFALIWSVAGVINGDGRPRFDTFLRQVCMGKPPRGYEKVDGVFGESAQWTRFLPDEATCYEYTFDMTKHNWKLWTDTITKDESKIPPTASFETIIVPTLDTARYTFLLNTLLLDHRATLFVGPTGTGKTSYVQKLLLGLDAQQWMSIFINYSAQTHANQVSPARRAARTRAALPCAPSPWRPCWLGARVGLAPLGLCGLAPLRPPRCVRARPLALRVVQAQDIIDGKLDKRRKGVFGPPVGKRCVVFVDVTRRVTERALLWHGALASVQPRTLPWHHTPAHNKHGGGRIAPRSHPPCANVPLCHRRI